MSTTEMTELRGVEFESPEGVCFVAHCDREIGISTKFLSDERQAYCLNKVQFVNLCESKGIVGPNRLYHQVFNHLLKGIKGEVSPQFEVDLHTGELSTEIGYPFATGDTCAWK